MITGDRTKDRETLERLVWETRPGRTFGYKSLPDYISCVLDAVLEMYGPIRYPWEFYHFVKDMATEEE